MTEKNTLTAAIENTFFTLLSSSVNTCLPGRIETYNVPDQRASVKPLLKKVYIQGEVQALPIITNVPIVFPRTKKSGITFPLVRGDGVLLVFSQRALERWKSSGEDTEPGDPRKFDLSDGIAIPGLFSFKQPNLASNNNDLEIHHEDQKVTIKKNSDIELGTGLLLSKLVNDTFMTIFNTHTHAAAGAVGAPTPPVPLMTTTNLTSKVKAQ